MQQRDKRIRVGALRYRIEANRIHLDIQFNKRPQRLLVGVRGRLLYVARHVCADVPPRWAGYVHPRSASSVDRG